MNTMKRILAMLLAILMVASCAFAEGDVLMIAQDVAEEHVHEEAPAPVSEEETELADLGEVLFEEIPAEEEVIIEEIIEEEIIDEQPVEEEEAEGDVQSVRLIQTNDDDCYHEWYPYWDYDPETGEETRTWKCDLCGVLNTCEHEWYDYDEDNNYISGTDNDDGTHNAQYTVEYYGECMLCGVEGWHGDDTVYTVEDQAHDWRYDSETKESYCRVCSAKNTCKHNFEVVDEYRDTQDDTMKDNGDGTHSYKYYAEYTYLCSECGCNYWDYDEENLLTEKAEKHDFSDGTCWHCGAENTCTHKNKVEEYTNEYAMVDLHSKDADGHTITAYTETWYECPDCGEYFNVMSEEPTTVNEKKPHEWWYGECEICGFANPCKHPNWVAEWTDYSTNDGLGSIVSVTDTTHTLIGDKYEVGNCPDCGEYVRKLVESDVQFTEAHDYDDDGECWRCRHKNTCTHEKTLTTYELYTNSDSAKLVDANHHTITGKLVKIVRCKACGQEISESVQKSYTFFMPHDYTDQGKCWECGFVKGDDKCEHEYTYTETGTWWVRATPKNEKKHIYTLEEREVEYCEQCGKMLKTTVLGDDETHEEMHYLNAANICNDCGYVSTCKHKNTSSKTGKTYKWYYGANDSKHYVFNYTYTTVTCDDCDAVLSWMGSSKITEGDKKSHSYDGHECEYCGVHDNNCEHEFGADDKCIYCGMVCVHDFKKCVCTVCGKEEHTGLGLGDCYCEGCKETLHDIVDDMCTRCGNRIVDIQKLEVQGLDENGVLKIGTKLQHQIGWKMEPADALANLTFTSSNKKVATVDANGVITGVAAGKATITIIIDNYEVDIDPVKFTVKVDKAPTSVATQKAPKGGDMLCVGETVQLNATVKPAGVLHTLTWTSSNEAVATVDANGLVTGVAAGTAKITVKTQNGKKASYSVKVAEAPTGMDLGIADNVLLMGEKQTYQIKPVMTPEGAGSEVSYSVEGTAVTVSEAGKITAKEIGSAQITVKTWGLADQIINVTVVKAPGKVAFNRTAITASLDEKTLQLKPVIADDEHAGYTWSSSNKKIAKVDANGNVEFLKKGTVTITVKTHNGKKAKCKITIMPKAPTEMSAVLAQPGLFVGESTTVKLKFGKNEGSSNIKMSFVSGEGVVSYADGLITALKTGTAKLRFEAYNGVSAECDVIVSAGLKSIEILDSANLVAAGASVGQKFTLGVERIDEEGNKMAAGDYSWKSENKNATIDKNGKLTIKKAGEVKITVTAYNGISDELVFTAVAAPKKVILSAKKATLGVNESMTLSASVDPASPTTLTVKSSNAKVAEVTELAGGSYGIIAKKAGSATISVKTHNGKIGKCVVTVKAEPTGVTLNAETMDLALGETGKLTAKVSPKKAAQNVTWTSSNEDVAKVENGVITTVGVGSATITAETYNGKSDACTVKVWPAPAEVKVTCENSMTIGQKQVLDVQLLDANGNPTVGTFTIASSNKSKVAVKGITIQAKKATSFKGGEAVTVTAFNGVEGYTIVNVYKAPSKVSLAETKATLKAGDSVTLQPKATIANAAVNFEYWGYTYSSSKKSVATVDENGKITAVAPGSATITVKTPNGKKATFQVTVTAAE